MVLMDYVMAVDRILSDPIAEAEEELDTLVRMDLHYVLARMLDGQRRRRTVARQYLVFLKMDMDGVRPISG